MTCIVYRDGVLAGDSLITMGSTKSPEVARKVNRLRTGQLFGSSGNEEGGHLLRESLLRGDPTPPKLKSVNGLRVDPNGSIWFYEGLRWTRVTGADFAAIGSGADYAIGALYMGASAKEAVRIAAKCNTHCGGRIYSVSLKKKRRGKTRR